jgi:hypothetical protein
MAPLEAKAMTLEWETGPRADTALFMLGGMIPLHLRAEDRSWAVRGVDGRRKTGVASSRGEAKRECLKGIEETLKSGIFEIDAAVRELR